MVLSKQVCDNGQHGVMGKFLAIQTITVSPVWVFNKNQVLITNFMRQKKGVTEIGIETDTSVCSAKGYTDSQLLEFLIKL